jgi:hypothetical protein
MISVTFIKRLWEAECICSSDKSKSTECIEEESCRELLELLSYGETQYTLAIDNKIQQT